MHKVMFLKTIEKLWRCACSAYHLALHPMLRTCWYSGLIRSISVRNTFDTYFTGIYGIIIPVTTYTVKGWSLA
jgi:hypothetical protein